VLKYLIAHRDRWVSREQLMETFWPGSAVDAARNSLNVAVHGLRRALRTAPEPGRGPRRRYLPPARRRPPMGRHTEKFQRHAEAGQRLEAAGDLAASLAEYELAAALYGGDFLDDDPTRSGRCWPGSGSG